MERVGLTSVVGYDDWVFVCGGFDGGFCGGQVGGLHVLKGLFALVGCHFLVWIDRFLAGFGFLFIF